MKKMGSKFLPVSADMFKKFDSLGQRWFKKIDPKAKSTPVARVNGTWMFDSKDIVKALLEDPANSRQAAQLAASEHKKRPHRDLN